MNITFKITERLLARIRNDLARSHEFAFERVGFISAGLSMAVNDDVLVLARDYRPVEDEDYLPNEYHGAIMGPEAIRKALQWTLSGNNSVFHVHIHGGYGRPFFSGIDLSENARFMPDFLKVSPGLIHGALVLSDDSLAGLAFLNRHEPAVSINNFVQVGGPIRKWTIL